MTRRATRVYPPLTVAFFFGLVSTVTPMAHAQTGAARVALPSPWFAGYEQTVEGQELEYHSPLPEAQRSLLVRSDDSAPAPPNSFQESAGPRAASLRW